MALTREAIDKKLYDFLEHFHTQDLDSVVAMYAEDAVFKYPDGTVANGRDEIRDKLKPSFDGTISDQHWNIERNDIDVSKLLAWSIWELEAKLGEHPIKMRGAETFEFNDAGLIVRHENFVKAPRDQAMAA